MTDYTVGTGSGGVLLLRDNGSTVDFYIKAGNSTTLASGKSWSWYSPNGSGSGTFSYPSGGNYLLLGSITVTTSGNVSFTMGATGTSGLGGPTTITQYLTRGSVPGTPGTPVLTAGAGSLVATWAAPSTGGATTSYNFQYSKHSDMSSPVSKYPTTNTETVTGLDSGTTYYVRVYAQNGLGSSPWSGIASIFVGIAAHRWNGTAEVPVTTAVRWNGTAEVAVTTAVRWNGTAEVPLA